MKLNLAKIILLAFAGISATSYGAQTPNAPVAFEVASIKPNPNTPSGPHTDFTLNVARDDLPAESSGSIAPGEPFARMVAAVEELGLKIETRKAPVDVLIVDKAEHPIPN